MRAFNTLIALMSCFSLVLLFLLALEVSAAQQKQIDVGNTWPVDEPDPIEDAKDRANNIDPKRLEPKYTYRQTLAAEHIRRVIIPKQRIYVPHHTLERTIFDRDGNVLYPQGFTYNWLEYAPFRTERIVIIDEKDAEHISEWLKATDVLIVNEGDLNNVTEVLERKVTMLDKLTAKHLDVTRVPVVIFREHDHFRHVEFLPDQGAPL